MSLLSEIKKTEIDLVGISKFVFLDLFPFPHRLWLSANQIRLTTSSLPNTISIHMTILVETIHCPQMHLHRPTKCILKCVFIKFGRDISVCKCLGRRDILKCCNISTKKLARIPKVFYKE